MPVPLSQFILRDGILSRTASVANNDVTQVVTHYVFVEAVLKLVHNAPQAGLPARDKTLAAARTKFYWPTMRLGTEKQVAQCLSCAQTKGTTKTAPILEYPMPNSPFDVVGMNLLQLPRSQQGSNYVLVCIDCFSRFAILEPLPTKSAQTVAHATEAKLICPYTTPQVLLSYNGT